jgi:hypothetical protein
MQPAPIHRALALKRVGNPPMAGRRPFGRGCHREPGEDAGGGDLAAFVDGIRCSSGAQPRSRAHRACRQLHRKGRCRARQRQPRSLGALRHAHASHAIDNGAPITVVSATLGHADLKTTSVYAHARPGEGSAAVSQGDVTRIDDCECPPRLTRQHVNQILKGLREDQICSNNNTDVSFCRTS